MSAHLRKTSDWQVLAREASLRPDGMAAMCSVSPGALNAANKSKGNQAGPNSSQRARLRRPSSSVRVVVKC